MQATMIFSSVMVSNNLPTKSVTILNSLNSDKKQKTQFQYYDIFLPRFLPVLYYFSHREILKYKGKLCKQE